jgi:hypothetical protein
MKDSVETSRLAVVQAQIVSPVRVGLPAIPLRKAASLLLENASFCQNSCF